jgi:glycosyltransferase involved in cell wall biosynthesis
MKNIVFSGRAKDEVRGKKKVCFCIPTLTEPFVVTIESLQASAELLEAAGWEHGTVFEVGNPYISGARAAMLRKALDWGADVIVFIDHDLSWKPEDLVLLVESVPDVVGGTYRFKTADEVKYMGLVKVDENDSPVVEKHGDNPLNCHLIRMESLPAGFLKVTRKAVGQFMLAYPELVYGDVTTPHVDLFNHGAHGGKWWGEDYAFCRRWNEIGGLYCIPNLEIDHHLASGEVFAGNFHEYLLNHGE